MLIKVPAITQETRKGLLDKLDKHFKPEEGKDLQNVVSEILNDKDVFTFLATVLDQSHGIIVGKTGFYDDIQVDVVYGLTLDFTVPRNTTLFTYENYGGIRQSRLRLMSCFPGYSQYGADFDGQPSPEHFAAQVNAVLKDPDKHVVKLVGDKQV